MFTITAEDFPPKKKKWIHLGANSLRTDDIEGARPKLPGYQYMNKPNFYSVEDIEKASPQPRYRSLNKPEYNLQTNDIPNASPSSVNFKTNRKGHNPLTPEYNLATFSVKPSTPPRFIRDTIDINDIEGSKPSIYSKWQTRNSTDISDIPGATAKQKKDLVKPDLMNPKDINTLEVFESKRKTNPLMPEYLSRDENNKLITIGQVDGSMPKRSVNLSQSPHSRHLDTKDIDGATAGTKGNGPLGTKLRNYIRSPNDTLDIEGAQSGTYKKGITTIRATNPLDPNYTWMTEEPSTEVKKVAETLPNDKFFIKNQAKFWGATPSVSEISSRKSSEPPTPGNDDLKRNAKRFYGQDLGTPNTLQLDFNKNATRFFEPTGKMNQISYLPEGSIHKTKKQAAYVDVDSQSYQDNAKKFFYGNTPIQSRTSSSVDPAFKHAMNDFYAVTPLQSQGSKAETPIKSTNLPGGSQKVSSRNSEASEYKFSLSRAEIGKPEAQILHGSEVKKSNTGSISGHSERKSLTAAAKQQIYS